MWFLYGALGLVAGIFGGFLGIGGGSIVIPALVYLFGFAQHQAQGTALAMMVPPIVLLAAIKYYLEGNVKVGIAVCLCIGFFLGGFIGAHFAHKISDPILKKVFGAFLLVISLKMILSK